MGFEMIIPQSGGDSLELASAFSEGSVAIEEASDWVPRIDDVATYREPESAPEEGVTSMQLTLQPKIATDLRREVMRRMSGKAGSGPKQGLAQMGFSKLPGHELTRRLRNLGSSFKVRVANHGSRPLLLLMGEVLSGGFVDRVISRDTLIEPGEKADVHALCVEGGRNQGARDLTDAEQIAHPSLRAEVISETQPRLWATIAGQLLSAGLTTPAASYRQMRDCMVVRAALERFSDKLPAEWPERPIGLALRANGELQFADTFQSPCTFARFRERLERSYLLEIVLQILAGDLPDNYQLEPLTDPVEPRSVLDRTNEGAGHTFHHRNRH